jgi:hypothetical protein
MKPGNLEQRNPSAKTFGARPKRIVYSVNSSAA